jgi:hypothetical protein
METVKICDELDLDLALLVPCFETEDNGLGFAAFTILPIDAVGVAEVEGVGSCGTTVGKIRRCYCRQIGRTDPF